MQPPPPIPARGRRNYAISIALGGAVAIVAMLREGWILYDFYLTTASLAPGTEIRPMGVAVALGITETTAALVGCACLAPGLILGLKHRSWRRTGVACVVFGFCLVPLLASKPVFLHIVSLRGLILAE